MKNYLHPHFLKVILLIPFTYRFSQTAAVELQDLMPMDLEVKCVANKMAVNLMAWWRSEDETGHAVTIRVTSKIISELGRKLAVVDFL